MVIKWFYGGEYVEIGVCNMFDVIFGFDMILRLKNVIDIDLIWYCCILFSFFVVFKSIMKLEV